MNENKELNYQVRFWRHFIMPLIVLLLVAAGGVAGFMYLDRYSFLEALYMVVVTLTTVGFRPMKGMSTYGMVFDMLFVLVGVILIIVVIGRALEFIVSGEFVEMRRRRRMERKIEGMRDHYIICGFGRVGHQVAFEFDAAKIPYVVVDQKPETAGELGEKNIPYIVGDITSDKILTEAGIDKARGLVASADSDIDNVFVTLSARTLKPNLYIIARAGYKDAEEKLRKVGANRVISPYYIAGKRMAAMATKPAAVDFLDTVMHSEHMEMEMREFKVNGKSPLSNKTLGEAQIRQHSGAYIATIRLPDGTFNLQPVADSKIETGDVLVAIGTPKQLDLLEKILS